MVMKVVMMTHGSAGKQDKWSSTSNPADSDSTLSEGRTVKGYSSPSYWRALQQTPAKGKFCPSHFPRNSHFAAMFCLSISPLSSLTPNSIILRRFTRPPVFNRNSLFFCFLSESPLPHGVWWCWSVCLIKLFISAGYGGEIRSSQSMIQTSASPLTRRPLR